MTFPAPLCRIAESGYPDVSEEISRSKQVNRDSHFKTPYALLEETVVAQWLRCCATNRKVAGSIPAGVNFSLT